MTRDVWPQTVGLRPPSKVRRYQRNDPFSSQDLAGSSSTDSCSWTWPALSYLAKDQKSGYEIKGGPDCRVTPVDLHGKERRSLFPQLVVYRDLVGWSLVQPRCHWLDHLSQIFLLYTCTCMKWAIQMTGKGNLTNERGSQLPCFYFSSSLLFVPGMEESVSPSLVMERGSAV